MKLLNSDHERLASLDSLRGIAGLTVFIFHYVAMTSAHTNASAWYEMFETFALFAGSLGTNLLLLLSGFLVGRSVSRSHFDYPGFLSKRLVRIYLPYVVLLGAAMVAWWLVPEFGRSRGGQGPLEYFLHQIILVPGLFPSRPALTVSWTLSYILAGYILLPLFALLYKRVFGDSARLIWLWATCALVTLVTNFFLGSPMIRVCYLPAGCMLAELVMGRRALMRKLGQFAVAAGVAMSLIGFRFLLWKYKQELGLDESSYALIFFICGCGAVSILTLVFIAAEAVAGVRFAGWWAKALQFIGKRGYSFYLLHGAATKMVVWAALTYRSSYFGGEGFAVVFMLICLSVAVGFAHVSHYFLEVRAVEFLRNGMTLSLRRRLLIDPSKSFSVES